jgi:hypothetical protein
MSKVGASVLRCTLFVRATCGELMRTVETKV